MLVEELVGLEAADQTADYLGFGGGGVAPEDDAGEEARGEGVEGFRVEGVGVGDGEEEGVYAPEDGDVVLCYWDDARLAGERGRCGEEGYPRWRGGRRGGHWR